MISFFIMSNEQTHPLHATDKKIIDSLISKDIPEDFDLINLARLINLAKLIKSKSSGISLDISESIIFLSVACRGWVCSLLIIKKEIIYKTSSHIRKWNIILIIWEFLNEES